MLFRQLFDENTATYTYLLADEDARVAVLIDPVREHMERDVRLLEELDLQLSWVLETHVHADHVTSAGTLRSRLGARTVMSKHAGVGCADVAAEDGDIIRFGAHAIEVRLTPGHTSGDATFVVHASGMAFTGDTLLIGGCGRTDFQQGDARTLYASVHDKIFSLPDDTQLFPGHDYHGRTSTTVGHERANNPRLGGRKTVEEFVAIMEGLELPYPRHIDEALPANSNCGTAPWAPLESVRDGAPEVSVRWVHEMARGVGVRIVDVRELEEWNGELGRLLGAEHIPLGSLTVAARRWNPRERLVVLCRSGRRSAKAAVSLAEAGFESVVSMRGGMQAWLDAGLPVERSPRG